MGGLVTWEEALATVARGRKPSELAAVVGVDPETARRWLRGQRVPCGRMWRALVIDAGMEDRWAELSAARDAVARPAGRPRLADDVYAAGVIVRRNRKAATRAASGAP